MPPEPAHTRGDELAMHVHHRREMSRQQLLKRWREWEVDISVVTDAHASICLLLLLPPMLYITKGLERGQTIVVMCAAAYMLVLVAHLFCVYARRQWYVRNRTPTIVALRMALVCLMLSAWVMSSLRLRRSQEAGSRVIIGMFLSLGYHITNQLLQLELQVVLLVITRALLFFNATRLEGLVECSYIGICRKLVDGVDMGRTHLWEFDVPVEERTARSPVQFAYTFDGFLFDALLLIVLPLAVANMKQRAREVTFAREELRRETEAQRQLRFDGVRGTPSSEFEVGLESEDTHRERLVEGTRGIEGRERDARPGASGSAGSARDGLGTREFGFEARDEGFEDDAGDATTTFTASGRGRRSFPRRPWLRGISRISQQIMPLMEFPDEALEARFDEWHRRAMLRVDLTRGAISCCTSLLWFQKFRTFCTPDSAGSFLPLHAMTWMFALNVAQVYVMLGHTLTYLRLRNTLLSFYKLSLAVCIFVARATLVSANAAILIQHYERYPRAAPEGEVDALRAWLTETTWAHSGYQPEPSTGPETPQLLVISVEAKLVSVLLQFFGTHQLMRVNVGLALFTVFTACVLEPLVLSHPPDAALAIRSKLFPSFTFTRLTNIFVDLTLLFLTGCLAERFLRASFAKEINLETRRGEFMRTPLARLRMTVGSFPPRPASRTAAWQEGEGARARPDAAERRGAEGERDGRGAQGGGGRRAGPARRRRRRGGGPPGEGLHRRERAANR